MVNKERISELIPAETASNIESKIADVLRKAGIYHRIFGRIKSTDSVLEKINRKGYPTAKGEIMQDVVGIRVALYFADDVRICQKIIEKLFDVVETVATNMSADTFSPERLNIVCKIPKDQLELIVPQLWEKFPIDKTFEVQLRTVFSEGWHEIEHDVRYKSKSDWDTHIDLSRSLNGILATVETCDWSIISIINELAYRQYKNKQWAVMLKNRYRIHLVNGDLGEKIARIFDESIETAKAFYRIDREMLLLFLACEMKRNLPLTLENIIYICNKKWIHDSQIDSITPEILNSFI